MGMGRFFVSARCTDAVPLAHELSVRCSPQWPTGLKTQEWRLATFVPQSGTVYDVRNLVSSPCLADYSLRRAFIVASWYRALCALVLLPSLICSPSHVAVVYQVKMRHRCSWYWKFGCMRGGSGCTSCSEEMTADMRHFLERVCQDAGL